MKGQGYLAAAVGWLSALILTTIGSLMAIDAWAKSVGGERWGFEFVLLIPAGFLAIAVISPAACVGALKLRHHDLALRTGFWSITMGVAALIVSVMFALIGMTGFVILAFPAVPIVARLLALRNVPTHSDLSTWRQAADQRIQRDDAKGSI